VFLFDNILKILYIFLFFKIISDINTSKQNKNINFKLEKNLNFEFFLETKIPKLTLNPRLIQDLPPCKGGGGGARERERERCLKITLIQD
jgi:hypothetical protein